MNAQDRYLKFVRWEEADGLYVGYCPDLFPWGGACHGATEEAAYRELCGLVEKEVAEILGSGRELPRSAPDRCGKRWLCDVRCATGAVRVPQQGNR